MPLNPKRAFNALLEGPLRLNDEGMWALYDEDEELTYWDEGQALELLVDGGWQRGVVGWNGSGYTLDRPDGTPIDLVAGQTARRRVGGSM